MIQGCAKSVQVKRLLTSAQFDKVLQNRTQVSNTHFALHYRLNHLSTDPSLTGNDSVDNWCQECSALGLIIPKRWAKHAVTRSLIKRQVRAQFALVAHELPAGHWVVRLKQGFDPHRWISCSSSALRVHIRQELEQLFAKAIKTCKLQQINGTTL